MSYLPETPAMKTWMEQESRLWNSPTSCGHRVQTKIKGLIENPLCTPSWGSCGGVLLCPKVWNRCHKGQELAIGITCFTMHFPLYWWPGHTQDTHKRTPTNHTISTMTQSVTQQYGNYSKKTVVFIRQILWSTLSLTCMLMPLPSWYLAVGFCVGSSRLS